MQQTIPIQQFFQTTFSCIIDVRSPAEYAQGRIPNAINLPLFTNEERTIVGTCYKKEGREAAIQLGLKLVGPKLHEFIENVKHLDINIPIAIHCWRGGMRSGSMAWLFSTYGFKTVVLKGGYKSYRNCVLESLQNKYQFIVLSGNTGSGKTHVLSQLSKLNEPIIDLEKFANHKGSAFGALHATYNVTQEQFENDLAYALQNKRNYYWIEDESRLIGNKIIPLAIWESMRTANVIKLEVEINDRIKNLISEYGQLDKNKLARAIDAIQKKMGGLNHKQAIESLHNNDLAKVCELTLDYYDKNYALGLSKREANTIQTLVVSSETNEQIAQNLIALKNKIYGI